MTLVDSIDSVLMLYAYAGAPDRASRALFERAPSSPAATQANVPDMDAEGRAEKSKTELCDRGSEIKKGNTNVDPDTMDTIDLEGLGSKREKSAVPESVSVPTQVHVQTTTRPQARTDIHEHLAGRNEEKEKDNEDDDDKVERIGVVEKKFTDIRVAGEERSIMMDLDGDDARPAMRTKEHTMSELSILLTLVSILVAFR